MTSKGEENRNGVNHRSTSVSAKKKYVRIFKERKSLLSHLFGTNVYVAGLYNLYVIQMVFFFCFVFLRDSLVAARPHLDLSLEIKIFGAPYDWLLFACLELVQLAGAFLVYVCFRWWMVAHKAGGLLADVAFSLLYGAYVLVTMPMVMNAIDTLNLPPVFRLISTMEHMRIVMKSYSFIRENANKILHPWHKDDESGPAVWYDGQMEPLVGTFSKYVYFLFAPTLLYRDNYPRMKGAVNWMNVLKYWVEFLVCIYIAFVLYTEPCYPRSFTITDLFGAHLLTLLLAPVMVLLCALIVLHSWHNFAAEVTHFADREFYTDWWNSESYTVYYRKWNVVVHDWLNAYVYQDVKAIFKSRLGAGLLTFFLSSLLHDYHAAVCMEFFVPVFLVMFTGFGGMMFLVRPKSSRLAQILTIAGFCFGVAIIESIYLTELAARNYCPLPRNETAYFSYRTPHCYRVYNSID